MTQPQNTYQAPVGQAETRPSFAPVGGAELNDRGERPGDSAFSSFVSMSAV